MDAEQDRHHLRVATFTAPETWHVLDQTLRGCVPAYAAQAGNIIAWLGRSGPGPTGARVLASVWSSRRAHDEATDIVELVAARGGVSVISDRIDVLPVRLYEVFERDRPMTILRVFRGHTYPGQLEVYLEEARAGTRIDGTRPDGPGSLVCGADGQAAFVTVSLWPDWSAIEACTGGNIQRPLTTRNAARIEQGAPTHFEIVPAIEPALDPG
ncbi:MAG: hypothetical protein ABWZ82_01865 [Candidatus Limnocylindrales bacterium]